MNKKIRKFLQKKPCKIIIKILAVCAIFGIGFSAGRTNFDNWFKESEASIKNSLLNKSEDYIENINKYLKDKEAKENEIIQLNTLNFAKSGTTSGHDYIQYAALTSDGTSYISFIYDKDNKELLASFVNVVHKTGDAIKKPLILDALIKNLEDKIPSDKLESIKEKAEEKEDNYVTDENFMYYQKFDTENIQDGYDYNAIYEFDFFKYEESK